MINTKIALSLMSIVAALAVVSATTFAFFTAQDEATGNTFAAGTLSVNLVNQNTNDDFQGEALVTNWAPGDETFVNFDVLNDGSLPVHLRGFAAGSWEEIDLDSQNVVKVVKVERFSGGWQTLREDSNGITGLFYYSDDGTETGDMIEVPAGQRAQLRLTVKFDEGAGNDFQGEVFTSSLNVEAKQIDANVWTEEPTP